MSVNHFGKFCWGENDKTRGDTFCSTVVDGAFAELEKPEPSAVHWLGANPQRYAGTNAVRDAEKCSL